MDPKHCSVIACTWDSARIAETAASVAGAYREMLGSGVRPIPAASVDNFGRAVAAHRVGDPDVLLLPRYALRETKDGVAMVYDPDGHEKSPQLAFSHTLPILRYQTGGPAMALRDGVWAPVTGTYAIGNVPELVMFYWVAVDPRFPDTGRTFPYRSRLRELAKTHSSTMKVIPDTRKSGVVARLRFGPSYCTGETRMDVDVPWDGLYVPQPPLIQEKRRMKKEGSAISAGE